MLRHLSMIDSGCMLWFPSYMPRSDALFDAPEAPPEDAYIEASPGSTNPIQICRKQLNLTLQQLSEATGVNLQAIHLLEQGCYFPVLPRIEHFFTDHHVITAEELREAYVNFQFHTRFTFGQQHKFDSFTTVGDWDGSTCPFEEFRIQRIRATRTGTAKGLCVQPAVLFRLANNQSKTIPSLLSNALLEAGLSLELLDELSERTRDYYGYR
jgi:hypothetical protein